MRETDQPLESASSGASFDAPRSPFPERRLAALILAGGALARIVPALLPRFWFDEVWTVSLANRPIGVILAVTTSDVHPPLYYFLIHFMMRIGGAIGGPFATLFWLRLASIGAGLAVCWMGWRAARRAWGARAGLVALTLLAFSPPLAFYSVELRSYAILHALLLGATLLMLRIVEGSVSRPRLALAGYAGCMATALYIHALAILYFAAHGAVLAIELARGRGERSRVARAGIVAAGAVIALYAAWIPILLRQNAERVAADVSWLPDPRPRDLISTLFFHMPFGTTPMDWSGGGPTVALMCAAGVFFAVAGTLACWRGGAIRNADRSRSRDRLWGASILMTLVPLGLAYFAASRELARIFAPARYNMVAAPFWALAASGLIVRIRARGARRGLFAIAATGAIGATLYGQFDRLRTQDDTTQFRALAVDPQPSPGDRMYLLDATDLPWLRRSGGFKFRSAFDLLEETNPPDEPIWIVLHRANRYTNPSPPAAIRLLERILESSGAMAVEATLADSWERVWRVEPEALQAVSRQFDEVQKGFDARRASMGGGQLILPGDPPLQRGRGWGEVEFTPEFQIYSWTRGERQRVEWRGPDEPGRYRFRASFWRPQPYPAESVEIDYRLPESSVWRTLAAGMGEVTLEGIVEITRPNQKLSFEMRAPVWAPADYIEGSSDHRRIGLQLLSISLSPEPD